MEGRHDIVAMLDATLPSAQPSNWHREGAATEAWIRFDTKTGRGEGHLRLNADSQAWTLLTTQYELKGFEEAKGATRPKGVVHGASQARQTWKEQREAEATHPAAWLVVPWWQPASVATLFHVSQPANQGAHGRSANPGLRTTGSAPHRLTTMSCHGVSARYTGADTHQEA